MGELVWEYQIPNAYFTPFPVTFHSYFLMAYSCRILWELSDSIKRGQSPPPAPLVPRRAGRRQPPRCIPTSQGRLLPPVCST